MYLAEGGGGGEGNDMGNNKKKKKECVGYNLMIKTGRTHYIAGEEAGRGKGNLRK